MATATRFVADPGYADLVGSVRQAFESGFTRDLKWRRAQLSAVKAMLIDNEAAFFEALHSDLGKGAGEALTSELAFVVAEIDHMLAHLAKWAAPERVSTPLMLWPGRSSIVREALGVVLVLGAWNLPVPVLLGPTVAAIAAGNAVVLKPSELAPATSALIFRLIPHYLDTRAIVVVEGGISETTALLRERFDHIFYTGNGRVGRIVAHAAADHLTPVTLELGGKNPVVVDRTADLPVTARRLAWAKWMNAGQVCVSPDYILADRAIMPALTDALVLALREFYGERTIESEDYGRIVNVRHHDRLMSLLTGHGGNIIHGGGGDRESLFIEPTIVIDPPLTSPMMSDEIFGPILPIIAFDTLGQAIEVIRARPKPLVVHVFTAQASTIAAVNSQTSSGALLANDAIVNHRIPGLPFGGVGESGSGAYHGRAGFETFSHRKAVLKRPTRFDNALRYPPFTARKLRLLRRLIGA
jgi:aldehyde dehydrogenase (NAD+)